MAAPLLKLLTTLLAVTSAASRAHVKSEAEWDLSAPDVLFAEGTAAYARGDWPGVVLSMERALRSRAALRALRLRCRTRCAADFPWELDPDSPPNLMRGSGTAALHDLHFFGGLLHRAACLRRCLGPPAAHSLSEELELEFHKRSPYNYLQVAYFKVQPCPVAGVLLGVVEGDPGADLGSPGSVRGEGRWSLGPGALFGPRESEDPVGRPASPSSHNQRVTPKGQPRVKALTKQNLACVSMRGLLKGSKAAAWASHPDFIVVSD